MEGAFIVKIKPSVDSTNALEGMCVGDNSDGINNAQQVNCKGDKIENIAQLLTHLGMDDIKHKCDACDIETRQICLEKINAANNTPHHETAKVAALKIDTIANEQQAAVLLSKQKKRIVENKLILSSIFASVLWAVITLQ